MDLGRRSSRLAIPAGIRHVAALLCLAASLWIVLVARLGPVVATLTPTHGIHSGDLAGVLCLAMATALLWDGPLGRRAPVPARVRARRW